MSGDLAAFYAVRLDEDEAAAKAATAGPWTVGRLFGEDGEWHRGSHVAAMGHEKRMLLDMNTGYVPSKHVETAEHIARHDPARALREVAAGRALLNRYAYCKKLGGVPGNEHLDAAVMEYEDYVFPAAVLRWSDHPDYRQEWAPTPATRPGS